MSWTFVRRLLLEPPSEPNLTERRIFLTRILVGIGTATMALIGLTSAASEEYRGWGVGVVMVSAMSAVPVSLRWFLGGWPSPRLLTIYVIYADVSLTACLIFKENHLSAISGTVLFAVVTTLTVVTLSVIMCAIHMGYAVLILITMAVRATVTDSAGQWVIVAHSMTMLLMFSAPLILLIYVVELRDRAFASLVDPLTGLYNRRGLAAALTEVKTEGTFAMSAVVIDLDGFKTINDTQGHQAGDEVLIDLACRLRDLSPQATALARLGGDEFACLFIGDIDVSSRHAQALISALSSLDLISNLTVSAGCSTRPIRSDEDMHEALSRLILSADSEMYQVKQSRKNPHIHPDAT